MRIILNATASVYIRILTDLTVGGVDSPQQETPPAMSGRADVAEIRRYLNCPDIAAARSRSGLEA